MSMNDEDTNQKPMYRLEPCKLCCRLKTITDDICLECHYKWNVKKIFEVYDAVHSFKLLMEDAKNHLVLVPALASDQLHEKREPHPLFVKLHKTMEEAEHEFVAIMEQNWPRRKEIVK